MKKNKIGIRIIAVFCAALGWWGLLYPELTLTPDIVRVLRETEDGTETVSESGRSPADNFYLELLGAERGSIRFRSRLLTEWNVFWEAFSWDRSTEN